MIRSRRRSCACPPGPSPPLARSWPAPSLSLKETAMPSSISSFKRRLRLPRLFFRTPSEEEQIHGGPPLEFERPIPPAAWRGITVSITIIVIAATVAWELYARSLGYRPTVNDNEDLWALTRRKVQPESIVIIGDSRP